MRCCWIRLRPENASAETTARKWSPPPVQSSTSARAPGIPASMRCLMSSAVGIRSPRVASRRVSPVATLGKALASPTSETLGAPNPMITLTDKGAEKVHEFLAAQNADLSTAGLRVGVRGGGCSGFQYNLAFDQQRDGDAVFEDHGLKLLVDRMSLPYVTGSIIDYVDSLQGAGFQVNNPNVVAACGCGSSFRGADEEEG